MRPVPSHFYLIKEPIHIIECYSMSHPNILIFSPTLNPSSCPLVSKCESNSSADNIIFGFKCPIARGGTIKDLFHVEYNSGWAVVVRAVPTVWW